MSITNFNPGTLTDASKEVIGMNEATECTQPKRHKMSLLTFLGLLLPVHIIPSSLHVLLPGHPLLAVSISVAVMVALMSYLIMPLMTCVVASWLYR